jgi:hypothetical protein
LLASQTEPSGDALRRGMHVDEAHIHPCDEDWAGMRVVGGGEARHCERCGEDVHDLSAIGPERARALLRSGRRVCVSYLLDTETGALVFEPPQAHVRVSPFVPISRLARAASLATVLSACTPHGDEIRPLVLDEEVPMQAQPIPATRPWIEPAREQPCEPQTEPTPKPAEPPKKRRMGSRVIRTAGVPYERFDDPRRDVPLGDL